jgi:cation diffusion facilitator family transporter
MLMHLHHDDGPHPGDGHAPGPGHTHGPDLAALSAGWDDPRKRAMAASLGVAVLMLVGKLAAFRLTGSSAILSDALESVIHLVATGIAAFSLWYAARPADPRHPYGHGKVAYFSAGFEGALILVAAVGIGVEAVRALSAGPELQRLGTGLLITGALAAVNAALGYWLIRTGRQTGAVVLVANGQHVLTDMWTSLGVLVGVGLVWATGIVWLDPVVALLAGANIAWSAVKLMREAARGLMDAADAADTERLTAVLEEAVAAGTIAGYHQLRHRRANDGAFAEVHLLFDDAITLADAHHGATEVEAALREALGGDALVTSHLEPEHHEHPGGTDAHPDDPLAVPPDPSVTYLEPGLTLVQQVNRLIAVLDRTISEHERAGEDRWAALLREDAARLRRGDLRGAENVLSRFGGMGSINDGSAVQHGETYQLAAGIRQEARRIGLL